MPWWVILRSVAFKAKRQDIKFDLQTTSTLAKCRAILQQLVLRSRKLWDVGLGKLNDVLGPQHVTRLLQAHVLSGAWVESRVFHIHHAQKNGFLNSTVQAGIWTSWSWCTRNRKIKSNFLSTSKVGWRNVTASYIISFDHLQSDCFFLKFLTPKVKWATRNAAVDAYFNFELHIGREKPTVWLCVCGPSWSQ